MLCDQAQPLTGKAHLLKVLDVQCLHTVIDFQGIQHSFDVRLVGVCWHVLLEPQNASVSLKLLAVASDHGDEAPEGLILQKHSSQSLSAQ